MSRYAIWDLDNCLANDAYRIPMINWSEGLLPLARYEAYHAACDMDEVCHRKIFEAVSLVATPVFLTGRPKVVHQKTAVWIMRNLNISGVWMLMRENDDHSTSLKLKTEMVRKLIKQMSAGDEIVAAFDDRPDIVSMYRKVGIPAMQLKIHDVDAYTHPVTGLERP